MDSLNLADVQRSLDVNVDRRAVTVSFQGLGKKFEGKEEVKEVVKAIEACEGLQILNLEGNTLGVEAAKEIGIALEKRPKMAEVHCKDLFTGRMKDEIPVALDHLTGGLMRAGSHVTVVDFSDNALGPNGMKGLVQFFKSSTCFSLQELKLNNCGLGITGGKMLAEALKECFHKGTAAGTPLGLKVFIAGRNRLENEGARALAEVFKAVGTLEEIAMPQNGIYHLGVQALSEAFKENPNLRVLNLNDNTITAKGAEHLRNAFYCLQKLQEINFGDSLLKTKGALLLADALVEQRNLEVVDLSFNEIRAEGGEALAEALDNKPNLQSVNLNGNMFGSDGREAIEDTLRRFDKSDCLQALDEDESDDEEERDEDDEEEGSDEEEYDEEYEEEDEENDGEEEDDEIEYVSSSVPIDSSFKNASLDNTADMSRISVGDDSEHPENTAEAFINAQYPTETMFTSIPEADKAQAIREYLKTIPDEHYLAYLVFTILKCAELSEKLPEALTVAEELFKDVFEYAKKNDRLQSVRNFFLVQLGLLKSEDKSFKPKYNIQGCRFALKSALQKDIIPEEEKNIYQFLLNDQHKTAPIGLSHP